MTKQRAEELFAQRGLGGTIPKDAYLPGEKEEISALWDKMPGDATFMDAFSLFLHPDDSGPNTWSKGRAQKFRKYAKGV